MPHHHPLPFRSSVLRLLCLACLPGLVLAAPISGMETGSGKPAESAVDSPRESTPPEIEQQEVERKKAEVVYKLAKFIRWPAGTFSEPDTPIRLCLLGQTPFAASLAGLTDQTAHRRAIHFQQLPGRTEESGQVSIPGDCQMLFVAESETKHLSGILPPLDGKPVLTISYIPNFARKGGMIGLIASGERVLMEINWALAREGDLQINSQLMLLATVIKPDKSGESEGSEP